MHTILISELISQLQSAQARGVKFTNVEELQCYGNTATLTSETHDSVIAQITQLEEESRDLNTQLLSKEKELENADNEIFKWKNEFYDLERELSDIEDENGVSVLDYKHRAEEAEKEAALARKTIAEWKIEIDALRKRKGVNANYFKVQQEIFGFLHENGVAGNKSAIEILEKLR